jgi:hypothetical protein
MVNLSSLQTIDRLVAFMTLSYEGKLLDHTGGSVSLAKQMIVQTS